MPFVQVVGNHDLNFQAPGDPGSTATYRRHFGPEYFSFDRGAVHYVVLDDVYWPGTDGFGQETDDYLGHIDATQLRWLEQDLALVEEGRPVVVFTHIPPLSTAYERRGEASPSVRGMIINREALYELLDPFDAHIVTGHVHENEHRYEAGPHEHVVGAVCGAWWTGPVCYDGTPRGYAVYEVNGSSVRWRYKSTGKDAAQGKLTAVRELGVEHALAIGKGMQTRGELPSSLVLFGPPGSGKTTFCSQFVTQGAKRGEDCLYVTMHETESQLREDMAGYDFGFDLAPDDVPPLQREVAPRGNVDGLEVGAPQRLPVQLIALPAGRLGAAPGGARLPYGVRLAAGR